MYYKIWMAEIDPGGLYYVRKTCIMEAERSLIIHKTGHVGKGSDDQPRDERGRWTSEGGCSDKKRAKPPKMSRKEYNRVTHGIATDFPRLKADGVRRKYEYGNYQYDFYVHDFAAYEFVAKRKLK